jgi:galactonate dehydratase
LPNAIVQAQGLDVHEPADNDKLAYLTDPTAFDFDRGYVSPPDGPGLGVDIDEDYLREQTESRITWQNPTWYHDDGSVAEW